MNDSIKSNRDLLKSGKKDLFERELVYPLSRGEIKFREKQYDPETIKIIRASALKEARKERIRTAVILIVSFSAVTGFMIYLWINL